MIGFSFLAVRSLWDTRVNLGLEKTKKTPYNIKLCERCKEEQR